jgi:hypothetical protein
MGSHFIQVVEVVGAEAPVKAAAEAFGGLGRS